MASGFLEILRFPYLMDMRRGSPICPGETPETVNNSGKIVENPVEKVEKPGFVQAGSGETGRKTGGKPENRQVWKKRLPWEAVSRYTGDSLAYFYLRRSRLSPSICAEGANGQPYGIIPSRCNPEPCAASLRTPERTWFPQFGADAPGGCAAPALCLALRAGKLWYNSLTT